MKLFKERALELKKNGIGAMPVAENMKQAMEKISECSGESES